MAVTGLFMGLIIALTSATVIASGIICLISGLIAPYWVNPLQFAAK
jgi:hypothetical protein